MSSSSQAILIAAGLVSGGAVLGTLVAVTTRQTTPIVVAPTPLMTGTSSGALPSATTIAPLPQVITSPQVVTSQSVSPVAIPTFRSRPPVNSPSAASPSLRPRAIPAQSVSPLPAIAATRPDPTRFIEAYYGKLQQGQYAQAWQDLTANWQQKSGGYGEYLAWWRLGSQRLRVGSITATTKGADQAVVTARCRFQGQAYVARYYLQYHAANQTWKIANITKL
jgi:hypothetical protein